MANKNARQPLSVTSVIRVKDRRHAFQFDLCNGALAIEYQYGKKPPVVIKLTPYALNALKELLGARSAVLTLPDEPVDRPPGSVPKEGIQGKETPDGMLRTPDGVESGMEE